MELMTKDIRATDMNEVFRPFTEASSALALDIAMSPTRPLNIVDHALHNDLRSWYRAGFNPAHAASIAAYLDTQCLL